MGKSKISYFKEVGGMVWNPITGCSGKGCQADCYARRFVKARPAMHGIELGVGGSRSKSEPLYPERVPFNRVVFHEDRLNEPLKRKKPTVYGVGFFGDMFDDQVKIEWLAQVFRVIHQRPEHTFIFLTKQPQNIPRGQNFASTMPNAWFGVTVCTQAEADERIPELLKVPGRKWLSLEPLLGPVDLRPYLPHDHAEYPDVEVCKVCGVKTNALHHPHAMSPIGLVILGGESGPKARPCHPDWIRSVRDQCAAAGVPLYIKQIHLNGKLSKDINEWPEEFRIQELPWRSERACCGVN